MKSYQEYKQFKAFTRFDGALLGGIMCLVFFAFIASMNNPSYQLLYIIGMFTIPVFAIIRLRNYRDVVVAEKISRLRAFGYTMSCFIHASLILAIVVFIYFQYFDKGAFISQLQSYFNMAEMQEAIKVYGLDAASLKKQISEMETLRPVDVAFSMITNTIITGGICSLLISFFIRTSPRIRVNNK